MTTFIDEEPRRPINLLRLPETDEELWWTVRYLWGIEIPNTAVCEGHVAPFTAFADAYFARSPVYVWKASRGLAGKTFTLATLTVTEAALLSASSSLVGGSGHQASLGHDYTQQHWNFHGAPTHLLSTSPTKRQTTLRNGAKISVLAASTTSVRGPHPQRLRGDEIDEMDWNVLTSALGQPLTRRGIRANTVLSSTHQYPQGTMTRVLEELAPEKAWPVYEWCYRETLEPYGWLTEASMLETKDTVPYVMWLVEYELQEPSVENRAMDLDKVKAAFDPALGEFEGAPGELLIFEPPQPDTVYVTGVDWAKRQDWTVIATFRLPEWRCVAWQRVQRQPWPDMVALFKDRLVTYTPTTNADTHESTAVHDATGLGDVIHDYLDEDDELADFQIDPIVMTGGRPRRDMFSDYIGGIEDGTITYPRIRFAYDQHRYCVVDDLYGRGHPPDSIVAGAVAYTRRQYRPPTPISPAGVARPSPYRRR